MTLALDGAAGLRPGVVARSSGDADLLLSRFDQVHRYTGTGNIAILNTLLVEDAVYEMQLNSISGTPASNFNMELLLQPNSLADAAAYAGQFIALGVNKQPGTTSTSTNQATIWSYHHPEPNKPVAQQMNGFFFDAVAGNAGINSCAIFRLDTRRANKTMSGFGGDTEGTFTGISQWKDASIQWSRVGYLSIYNSGVTMTNTISYVINIKRLY